MRLASRNRLETIRFDPKNEKHVEALGYIGRNLRPEDLYEIAAVGLTSEEAMGGCLALARNGAGVWLLVWDGTPVFVWGVNQHHKGTYGLFGFGTNKTRRAMPAITDWGMGFWLHQFIGHTGARRIEVRVPVSSVHSINWLTALGMTIECTLPNYSVHGEDFFQLSFTIRSQAFENVQPTMVRDHRAETSPGHSSSL